jgi:hypothetical protein
MRLSRTLLVAAVAALTSISYGQDLDPEMMAKLQPGEMHKLLAKMAGEWTVAVKFQMGPDQPMQEATAECKATMILNGGFLKKEYTSEMMGQPFYVHETMGFDGLRGHFFQMTLESMGTGYMFVTGKLGDDKKSIVLTGESPDPMNGGKTTKSRMVYKLVSDEEYVVEWYDSVDGKDAMVVQLTHKRKKS